MPKLLSLLKSFSLTLALLFALYTTGLLSAASVQAQRLLIHSGLLDANPVEVEKVTFPFDFTLVDLEGNRLEMGSLKGKVIFLNLWATWCGPCRAEMPGIQKLYSTLTSSEIVFVMLAIDKKGDEVKIKKYLQTKGFTFPVYRPVYDDENSFPDLLKVPSIPTTFVVDKQGMVVYKKVGTANYDTKKFRNFLERLTTETTLSK